MQLQEQLAVSRMGHNMKAIEDSTLTGAPSVVSRKPSGESVPLPEAFTATATNTTDDAVVNNQSDITGTKYQSLLLKYQELESKFKAV